MHKFRFASASELVSDIVETLRAEMEKDDCRIVEEIADVPPSLFRVRQLYTVVLNLLVNARTRTRPGGQIFVSVSADEDSVVLEVAYEGETMPREIIDEIVETADPSRAYLRGPETPKDFPFRVTCSMIKGMGGQVSASEVEGGGTRVRVTLPFVEDRRKKRKPVKRDRRKGDTTIR